MKPSVLSGYLSELDTVEGWLLKEDVLLFEKCDELQKQDHLNGDLLEVGAYHGKSAILLGYFKREGEQLVVCDLFENPEKTIENQTENERYYPDLSQSVFESNYLRFHDQLPTILSCCSTELITAGKLSKTFRFVHIDGSHLCAIVRQDIQTAKALLQDKGIVVFDDYRQPHTPGVAAAIWQEIANGGLVPFCLSAQKMYATWGGNYLELLRELTVWAGERGEFEINTDVVCGRELLRIGMKPTEMAQQNVEVHRLNREITTLSVELTRLRAGVNALREQLSERDEDITRLRKERSVLRAQMIERDGEITRLRGEVTDIEGRMVALQNSPSWKLSAPVRFVQKTVKGTALGRVLRIFYWMITFQLRQKLQQRRLARTLGQSGWFDSQFYLARNPDVALAGLDPIFHYVAYGAAEGRDPHPLFDTSFYVERNPDVVNGGLNPLAHYIMYGAAEGRPTHPVSSLTNSAERAAKEIPHEAFASAARVTAVPEGQKDFFRRVRRRSNTANADTVLFLADWIPAFDRAGGALRTFNMLQILHEGGRNVVFGANRDKTAHVYFFGSEEDVKKYERALEGLKIGVHYGYQEILRYLTEEGDGCRFVILSFPEVACRYFPSVRAHAINAKVIYDPVDLHWLRMERESEIKHDDALRKEAEGYRRMEQFNAAAADIVFAVTDQEKTHILEDVPHAKVEVIPTIHSPVDKAKPATGRKNLLFIGHYAHTPNEDAVAYFVQDIFPLVRRALPGVVFYMVGSHITEKVKSLVAEDVVAVGYVEDLSSYLDDCRIFVAPLRYGAGIKAKIGQSMSFGLPVVTTSIGAEGMNLTNGKDALIADSATAFASAVVRLYTDELLWEEISTHSLMHVNTHFSNAMAKQKLQEIFAAEI